MSSWSNNVCVSVSVCARAEANDVFTFGAGSWGQLGLESEASVPVPTLIQAFLGRGIKIVSCGAEHTAAISGRGDPLRCHTRLRVCTCVFVGVCCARARASVHDGCVYLRVCVIVTLVVKDLVCLALWACFERFT